MIFLERRFHLFAHGTTAAREAFAGLTTFLTMGYIVFVQPAVLSAAGMDFGAVMVATCLSTALATALDGARCHRRPVVGHPRWRRHRVSAGHRS